MSGNQDFVIENGVLTEYKGPGGEVTIPEGVTGIGSQAFQGCTGLTSVTTPESVGKIEASAFSSCVKLASVTIWASSLTEQNCWMFGKNGKTIPMVLLRKGEEPFRTVAVFRREYYMQQWSCEKDILPPLDPADVPLYDALIAARECEGFKITNDGRVRAMLLRLLDPERPVAQDVRNIFAGFLSSQVNKALKYAQADGEPGYIRALRDVGAISDEELPKLRKKLASSKAPAFSQLAGELDAPAAEVPAEAPDSQVERRVLDRLHKLNANSVLMKYNLTALPDLPLARSDKLAPKAYLQLLLVEYISQVGGGSYRLSKLADKTAEKLDGKALREALLKLYEKQSDKTRQVMVPAVCWYADGASVSKLYHRYAANKRTTQTAEQALLFSDTREAMLLADKYGCLSFYAKMRGTDEDTFRDTVLVLCKGKCYVKNIYKTQRNKGFSADATLHKIIAASVTTGSTDLRRLL